MLIALFLSVSFAQEPAAQIERGPTLAEQEFLLISNRFCSAKLADSKSLEAERKEVPLCILSVNAGLATLSFNVPMPCSATTNRCETTMTVEIGLPAKNPLVIAGEEMKCGTSEIVCTLHAEKIQIGDASITRTVVESYRKGESRALGRAAWLQTPDGELVRETSTP